MSHSTESQTLGDWITACDDFLALPRTVMQDVGPAAQTLGAVYALTGGDRGGQMRESLDTIRQVAVLPRRTVQTHIPKLVEAGWVESLGRGLLPRSAHRRYRTVTLKLTRQAVDMKEPFWMLPRWAATRLHTWSERALFAYLCSACKLVETIELGGEGCAEGREFRKPTIIATDTGLSLPSIRAARDKLRRAHLINAYE
ncbi:MAG TPA: hypothetical protein VFW87_22620, partial [Pirellulales bacterium]|nr:hypothetical protein [Pirellulales bacterium]